MKKQVTWYFAFTEGHRSTFWSKVTKKSFSHVVFYSQTGPTVTSIEPLSTAININAYYNTQDVGAGLHVEDMTLLFLADGFKVVRHTFDVYDKQSIVHIANLWPSCVTMAKVVTGYRSWAHTPYQLYKSLLFDGAVELERNAMGGIFSKPKAPKPVVPDNRAQMAQLEKERKQAEAKRLEEEGALQREEELRQRRQRGRLGLIATSETGVKDTTG